MVDGLDVTRTLEDPEVAALRAGLLEHQVLFVRGAHLDDDQHLALARRLGEPLVFPIVKLMGGDRVLSIITDDADSPPDADGWHTDVTWSATPPSIALLCALDIPAVGGDTLWASTTRTYDALSPVMQRICDPLEVYHHPGQRFIDAVARSFGPEVRTTIEQLVDGATHPLVKVHPETGRKALFLGGSFMQHVVGMHPAESTLLLGYLQGILDDPNLHVRWHWQPGDLAIWDERSTNHRALSDHFLDAPQHRRMRRCTVE
jgi:taurine dioxygenase